jgi:hypothetical protein
MPHFLVSGIAELGSSVADELRAQGSTAVQVDDIEDVARACAEAGEHAFDGYIQLPATFSVVGPTAVDRLHCFFVDGVMARFPAMAAALPTLRAGSRITFVTGVLPPEISTDDDVAARAALLRVLSRAARADGPSGLRVSSLGSGSTPKEIVTAALGRDPKLEQAVTADPDHDYDDWRVEVLGMMSALN